MDEEQPSKRPKTKSEGKKFKKTTKPKSEAKEGKEKLVSATLGSLVLCTGRSKSELCGFMGGVRNPIISCDGKASIWHRELISSLALFAASQDEATKSDLQEMKALKLKELRA